MRRIFTPRSTNGTGWVLLAACMLVPVAAGQEASGGVGVPARAIGLDQQVDWSNAKLIAVQEGGRYKTLDSFARESFSDMYGAEHFPELSPTATLLEWLFHAEAYDDEPVIKIRNKGLIARLVQHLPAETQERIRETKRFTPNELNNDPTINRLLTTMQSDPIKRKAVNKVRNAQAIAQRLAEFFAIVPQPGGDASARWFTPRELLASLPDEQLSALGLQRGDAEPAPGVTPDQALFIVAKWAALRHAWLSGDAAGVQKNIDALAAFLPKMAAPGVYPSRAQRAAEAKYYAFGKFTFGWILYFLGLLIAALAMVTRWRTPWLVALVIIIGGLGVHIYGVLLRWYILGRIPVANMFEAVVASAAIGMLVVLVIEVVLRTRVLLVGTAALGFVFLVVGQFVLPGSQLGVIPGILDDIQLRLHTVMIIAAYGLIFLAAVVALIYVLGFIGVKIAGGGGSRVAASTGDVELAVDPQRPLLAGAAPGDEIDSGLPGWLNNIDWAHLIILNMVFVLLFVGGIVLGAWWADYSWGRPWGWDPKEVFALNTWIVYAILLHLRFVVRRRGLWTAVLSIIGCAVMAFNWFIVNFFIASVHSYA